MIQNLIRPFKNLYFDHLGYPLSGVLDGFRMTGERIGDFINGNYEIEICKILMKIVKPGWVCADVGAHVGYFTLVLSKLVGKNGYVIAFEANPENTKRLRSNISINGLQKRVKAENVAVTNSTQKGIMLFPGRNNSSFEWNITGHDLEGNPTKPGFEISSTFLDEYFPDGSCLDFIKIDVEGAEDKVILGMKRILRDIMPLVLIEFHDEKGWEARKRLFEADYRLYDINEARWIEPASDIKRIYHCLAVPGKKSEDFDL